MFFVPRLQIPGLQAIPILALIYYFYVSARYRTGKVMPESDVKSFLSPICGKVTEIREDGFASLIFIERTAFTPADLRSAHIDDIRAPQGTGEDPSFASETIGTQWWIPTPPGVIVESRPNLPGMLIGLVPGNAVCRCRIPNSMTITVTTGEKVIAGENVLARIPEPVSEPITETEE
jgi:hypothetical protein